MVSLIYLMLFHYFLSVNPPTRQPNSMKITFFILFSGFLFPVCVFIFTTLLMLKGIFSAPKHIFYPIPNRELVHLWKTGTETVETSINSVKCQTRSKTLSSHMNINNRYSKKKKLTNRTQRYITI
jgi:hypothetical protein